jgi:hypothetical protein
MTHLRNDNTNMGILDLIVAICSTLMRRYVCISIAWTHSEERLDCRVKVELKVLYIQEVEGGGTHPLLVL